MQESILKRVSDKPSEINKLTQEETKFLCKELRTELINSVSKTGGHLASNLGAVELTVAIHKNFNLQKDKVVFDVGHQSYVHKMLTGRLDKFNTLRQKGGISGFPKPEESEFDAFATGHSSTSVSAAFGLAEAKREKHESGYVVAVVGDGAISGGLIYEGLNNAGRSKDKLIVILNDNKMSISKNVGAMSRYLAKVRSKKGYHLFKSGIEKVLIHIPFCGESLVKIAIRIKQAFKGMFFKSTIFEDFGFSYLGPIDGHDSNKLDYMLKLAKSESRPVLLLLKKFQATIMVLIHLMLILANLNLLDHHFQKNLVRRLFRLLRMINEFAQLQLQWEKVQVFLNLRTNLNLVFTMLVLLKNMQ